MESDLNSPSHSVPVTADKIVKRRLRLISASSAQDLAVRAAREPSTEPFGPLNFSREGRLLPVAIPADALIQLWDLERIGQQLRQMWIGW